MAVTGPFRLLLHDVQSPINIGMILRVAESFAVAVDILDLHQVLDQPEKRQWVSDFSCGAFARGSYRRVDSIPVPSSGGRTIATCLTDDTVSLPDFRFAPDDIVMIGNEYDGLPPALIAAADVRLKIPMATVFTPKPVSSNPIDPARNHAVEDGSPVLSAAMSAGILCYAGHAQRIGGQPVSAGSAQTSR